MNRAVIRLFRTVAPAVTLGALFFAPRIQAQDATPPSGAPVTAPVQDTQPLGDQSAIHSQAASFAVTKLKDTPAVVTVITQDEIRSSGARDLVDILMMVPGIYFGIDNQNTLGTSFRGLWGYEGKMLLLIDGKEMNEQLFSTIQLGNEYPVELIERVEVVRGPGSVIYGGNAELAVINVITRSVQGSSDVQVAGTYGELGKTYGRRNISVSGRWVVEQVPGLSGFLSAAIGQGQRSDRIYTDEFGSSASMIDNFHLDPLLVQAGVAYRDLQASVLFSRLHTTGVDGVDELLPAPVPNDFQALHVEVLDTIHINDRLDLTPRFNYSSQTPWHDRNDDGFYYDKSFQRIRGRLIARWAPLEWLQLTGGVDVEADHATIAASPYEDSPAPTYINGLDHIEYQNYAGFIEAYSENPIVNIVLGARYDKNSAFGDAFSPRVVLLRDFGPISAKALFSRAFRAPGVENISLGGNIIKPETTTVWEVQATGHLSANHSVSVNAFDLGVQNPIIYFLTAQDEDSYKNLGRLGSRGIEADYQIHGSWGRVQATYSFYAPYGTNLTPDYTVPAHSEVFAALPNHKATLSTSFNILKWLAVSPSAVLVGPRFQVNAPDETGNEVVTRFPTQLLLNLFVRAKDLFTPGLEAGLGGYNLLGTNFQALQPYNGGHAPVPFLSREFMLRLSYTWEPNR